MEKLTFEKLPEAIEEILQRLRSIEQLLAHNEKEKDELPQVLDVAEAGKLLKLKISTIYTKVSRGELPAFKSGKRLLFNRQELIELMQANNKTSVYQLQKEAELRIRHLPKTRKYIY